MTTTYYAVCHDCTPNDHDFDKRDVHVLCETQGAVEAANKNVRHMIQTDHKTEVIGVRSDDPDDSPTHDREGFIQLQIPDNDLEPGEIELDTGDDS